MALADHLRELRGRLLRAGLAVIVGMALAMVFYDQVFELVWGPYNHARETLGETDTIATTSGPGGGLLAFFKLSGLAGVIGTAPYWLYQIWAFIVPGLHPHERKWSRVFAAIAGPLFLGGVLLGYVTLPKGLEILIGFTPDGLTNLIEFSEYLSFFSRTLLVFGIAFMIPLFVVMLNMAGVLRGKSLGRVRPWIIIGVFIFAAVATPSADPFTMTFMAVPMVVLFFVSEVIARLNDRRRSAKDPNAGLSPDEPSTIA